MTRSHTFKIVLGQIPSQALYALDLLKYFLGGFEPNLGTGYGRFRRRWPETIVRTFLQLSLRKSFGWTILLKIHVERICQKDPQGQFYGKRLFAASRQRRFLDFWEDTVIDVVVAVHAWAYEGILIQPNTMTQPNPSRQQKSRTLMAENCTVAMPEKPQKSAKPKKPKISHRGIYQKPRNHKNQRTESTKAT